MSENTLVRMYSAGLSHVQLRLEAGYVIAEVGGASPDTPITLLSGSSKVTIDRRGLYRLEHEPAPRLKVFDGRAQVASGGGVDTVKKGWMLQLDATSDSMPGAGSS